MSETKSSTAVASNEEIEEISIYAVFSRMKHHVILFWISYAVFVGPLAETIYLSAIQQISADLHTSDALVTLSVSLFLLTTGLFSVVWGTIADRWGRNLSMRLGFVTFIISCLVCMFVHNIAVFLVLRGIQGATISVTTVVGQAIIADIYRPEERGWATGIFFVPIFIGVILGPLVGGLIAHYSGWRYIFLFLTIFTGIGTVIYFLVIPETLQYHVMKKMKNKLIKERDEITEPKLTNPCLPLKYLLDAKVFPQIFAASNAFGSILLNQTLLATILGVAPYSWNELQIGLVYLIPGFAEVIGCILGGWLADKGSTIFKSDVPGCRLLPGTAFFILIPIGLLMYGWIFQFKGSPALALFSTAIIALGQATYRPGVYSYLTVTNQQTAASVSAANNFLNYIFGALFISIAIPIDNVIGIGAFFSIIAGINLISVIWATVPVILEMRANKRKYEQL